MPLIMLSLYENRSSIMNVAMIELTDGTVALIDVADLALVADYEWHLPDGTRRVGQHPVGDRRGNDGCWKREPVFLHRLIAQAGPEDTVLHRNHDPLDNRRENLVVVGRQSLHIALPIAD